MVLVEIVGCLLLAGLVLYLWAIYKYGYWKRMGIKQLNPTFPFGDLIDVVLMRVNTGIAYDRLYKQCETEPAIGLYRLFSPLFLAKDIDLVRDILIKEFSSIHDNDIYISSSDPVFSNNPFVVKGEKWKKVRNISTQGLTTSRIKVMTDHMKTVSHALVSLIKKNEDVFLEAKLLGSKYTADVVTGCVYGLKGDSLEDPDSVYRKHIMKTFDFSTTVHIGLFISSIVPKMAEWLNLSFFPKDVEKFFLKIVKDTVNYREENNLQRNDFLQHLINLNEKGDYSFTMLEIMAHSMTFIMDGYETSSVLLSHLMDLLAQHPEVQNKLRDEVNSKIKSIDDHTFDSLHSLPYMEAVINETLRLRPPATTLNKVVTKDVTLTCAGKTYELKAGTSIAIPIFSIHMDERYYTDADQFIPERFLEDPNPKAFLPFGLGPRACLGSKFAITQVKACLATLVQNFEIVPKEIRVGQPEFDAKSFILLYIKGGIWVKFRSIKPN